jgi:hypothetical protein
MNVMGHLTNFSGFLTILSTDFAKFQKFDPAAFTTPKRDWVPPYPYCRDDVLFPVLYEQVDAENLSTQGNLIA